MDPLWITIAFILGFVVRQIGLPPLVGSAGLRMDREKIVAGGNVAVYHLLPA